MKKRLYLFLIITIFIFSLCSCKDQKGTTSTVTTTDIAEAGSHSVTSENNADVKMRNKYKINLYTRAYQYRDYQLKLLTKMLKEEVQIKKIPELNKNTIGF